MNRENRIFQREDGKVIVEVLTGNPGGCNGDPKEFIAHRTESEAGGEKHLPFLPPDASAVPGKLKVQIGSAPHMMTEAHWIEWIEICDGDLVMRKYLHPGDAPEAVFPVAAKSGMTLRTFCNLHGLWTKQI